MVAFVRSNIAFLSLVLLVLLGGAYFFTSYIPKVKIYEPISISVIGFDEAQLNSLIISGISPRGRVLPLERDGASATWNGYYAYLRGVSITIPGKITDQLSSIEVEIGSAEPFRYDRAKFEAEWSVVEGPALTYRAPETLEGDTSLIPMITSIYHWSSYAKGALITLTFILCFVLIFFIAVFLKSRLSVNSALSFLKNIRAAYSPVERIISDAISKRSFRITLTATLAIIYSSFLFNTVEYNDTAILTDDSYAYQSMAVNYVQGHGFHRMGMIEDFDVYKLEKYCERCYQDFKIYSGLININRNLGYPAFLSFVYTIFGIHPEIAKYIQLLLIICIAAGLPWLGYSLWGRRGLISGVVASPIYLMMNYEMAGLIMSEALVHFTVFILVLDFVGYEKRKTFKLAAGFGIMMAIGIMVKASLILIPFLFIAYQLYGYIKSNDKEELSRLLVMFSMVVLVVLPWVMFIRSEFTEIKSNLSEVKQVLMDPDLSIGEQASRIDALSPDFGKGFMGERDLSMIERKELEQNILPAVRRNGFYGSAIDNGITLGQKKLALLEQLLVVPNPYFIRVFFPLRAPLDVHNDLVTNGSYHPQWRLDRESLYMNDGLEQSSDIVRVANYYRNHLSQFPVLIRNKLVAGFSHFKFLLMFFVLLAIDSIGRIIGKSSGGRVSTAYALLSLPILALPFLIELTNDTFIYYLVTVVVGLFLFLRNKGELSLPKMPVIFPVLLLNFIIITALILGKERHTKVIEFVVILASMQYLISYLITIGNGLRKEVTASFFPSDVPLK